MVDFRRMIPVLAVIAFLIAAGTASAQQLPLSCTTNGGVPNQVRGEDETAHMGDFLITCVNGLPTAPGQAVPAVNISITLGSINITSRLMSTSNTLPQLSESVVVLDEAAGGQFGCAAAVCTSFGNGLGTANAPSLVGYYGSGTPGSTVAGCSFVGTCAGNNKNIFQGIVETNNRLTFFAVPIDPPGTSGSRIIRIANVRGNANQAGVNNVAVQIFETVSNSNPSLLPVSGNATQAVASVQRGLTFTVLPASGTTFTALGLQQCVSRASTAGAVARLSYIEGFGTAFEKRNVFTTSLNPLADGEQASLGNNPPGPYFTETMYTTNATSLQSNSISGSCPTGVCRIGQADWGTRVKAVFNNVPAGVSIFVDRFAGANSNTDFAQLTASEAGPFSLVPATSGAPAGTVITGFNGGVAAGTAQLTVVNNQATAVWEVTDSNANSLATFNFGVWATFTASPGTNSPALATATVNGSFAPLSLIITAQNITIPRFADTSTATNIFTVVPCVTNLLFPYLTSQFGFDTGIAISSTSTDPFGTSPQSGTCTLNWYGAAFTGATPTPVINSGTTWPTLVSTTLSNVTGGFTGYMIAQCRFQYAHGFAFVSDLGAQKLAMGYLALIIPDPARSATPFECGGGSGIAGCVTSGEQLGY